MADKVKDTEPMEEEEEVRQRDLLECKGHGPFLA